MNTHITNGLSGCEEFADTAAHVPAGNESWGCIEFLADTVFTAIQGNAAIVGRNATTGVVTSGRTYTSPGYLFGKFTGLTLTSGAVRCYFAS
jgi:hypothetical protein